MMQKEEGVAAVERALSILSAWREGEGALPLRELHRRTGLYKSTILRLLASLERHGCVARQADSSWALGPTLFQWGTRFQRSVQFYPAVPEHLTRLASDCGESAAFWVSRGDTRLCMFRVARDPVDSTFAQPGEHRPIDEGVSGIVLGGGGQDQPDGVVSGVSCPCTASMSVSAPVFGVDGGLCGALTLTGSIDRIGLRLDSIRPMVRDAAASLSAVLANPAPQAHAARPVERMVLSGRA